MRYRFLRFPGGKFKAVTFSYDDGLSSDIRLAKVLSDHGMKATFNVCSGLMSESGGEHYLSANEIKENIIPLGHEIAIHGHSHRAPGISKPIEIVEEFYTCRKNLENLFGGIIRGMAYPDSGIKLLQGGRTYEEIRDIIKSLDIVYARNTIDDRSFALPADWYDWRTTAHNTDPKIMEYVDAFVALNESKMYIGHRTPKLFFMWGHSPEFNKNDGWVLLDEICAKLSGREDTWYATNMEIYEYVKAYESLVTDLDGSTVYNPTLIKVWFSIDGRLLSVEPGETLRI